MREFLKRFAPYFVQYKARWSLAALGGGIGAAAYGCVYLLIKPVMDGVFIEADPWFQMVLPPAIVGLFVIYGLGRYAQTYYINWIGEDIVRRLRDRLLAKLLTFDMAFFNSFRGGELISRTTNDVMRVRLAVSQHLSVVVREGLAIIALMSVVVYSSPKLAFWGLVVLPAVAWPLSLLARRVKRLAHRSQEKDSDITSRLSEIFNNIEIIKAHHSESFELERFEKDNLEFRRINMKGVRAREMVNPLMEIIGAVAAALVIWFGGRLIISEEMTAGDFVRFAGALFSMYSPIKRISAVYNQFFEAVAASERIFDMLGREPEIRGGSVELEGPIQSVEFDDVHLSYGRTVALQGVSATVKRGQMLALIGDSGGGKSSLVNLVPRLFDPVDGVVRINGIDSRQIDLVSLRRRIGLVTQRVFIFRDTVASNVAYGLEIDRAEVETALKRAGAWDFVSRMEQGVDSVLEEFGANLSGGQRQRLAIARALYRKPDVLILDEATSALDNRSEAAIQRALEDVTPSCITFVIAHRLSTIEMADHVLLLRHGVVAAAGSLAELRESSQEFQQLATGELPA